MKIRIRFPDGSVQVFNYDIIGTESIDDIADAIASELARRYVVGRGITSKKTYLKVKAGALPWIRSHLLSEFMEIHNEIEREKKKREEKK
mgnify:CR=1 FL=1